MATNRASNLLEEGQGARGLSGGSAGAVALDEANPFYNFRLRRHRASGDLIKDPGLLWFTSPYVKQRTGLGTHVVDALDEGVATFTDVLVILAKDDYARAINHPEGWVATASRVLADEYQALCQKEGYGQPRPRRPLGFRFLCDGSADMGGQTLGLPDGEFVTGLLPNLYTGPVRGSHPVIAVHLNLPGAWDGYQEVGRLFSDQLLFTIGSHWLDNFHHPYVREAALYRLQQTPDGGFAHIVNPDLQDRYQVASTDQGGVSVLTLATRDGEPLAYMVLAVMDAPSEPEEPEPDPNKSMYPPMLIDDELKPVKAEERGKTIIPDAMKERIFTLQERGALLQRVHFSAFMLGYDVFLSTRGELGTVVDDVAATFQVRKKSVSLVAAQEDIEVDGRLLEPLQELALEKDHVIRFGGHRLEYRNLAGVEAEGWPYVGEIRRAASSTYMLWGDKYQIGRSRDCRVVLPDESRNDNIQWKPSVGDGATIKARTGEIPKSRFYTDSIMVASEHGQIELTEDDPVVRCLARHCFVYVRRNDQIHALYPTKDEKEPTSMAVQPGDEVLIGNCVFHVGYTRSDDEAVAPAAAPEINAESLAEAVAAPDFGQLDAPSAHEEEEERDPTNVPGRAPPAPFLATPAMDSIIGTHPAVGYAVEEERDGTVSEWPQEDPDEPPPPPSRIEPPPPPEQIDDEPTETPLGLGSGKAVWIEPATKPPADEAEPPPPPPEPPVAAPPPAPAAAAPAAPAPAELGPSDEYGEVVAVDAESAQFELGRELHIVHSGWMVNGTAVCGNHANADLVLPENRLDADQEFVALDYFLVETRGRKGVVEVLEPLELLVDGAEPLDRYDELTDLQLDVIRRDDRGEEDFNVRLAFTEDKKLPDPRARYIAIGTEDALVAALFTKGLPKGSDRALVFGGISMTFHYDGKTVKVSGYLPTYRHGDGFRPFFVQKGGGRFKTAPEDGADVDLEPGDRMVVGNCVYELREE